MKTDSRIPVTLLTGFLGAGKTTLLNQLMKDASAGRIAVIVNELGEAGLDHDLIEEATEETILMQSGCLCCTMRGDIARTLGQLMIRRNLGELSFDRVVVETTGIADPGPILHTLVVDSVIAPDFRLDGVVTVADAATGPATLDTQREAVEQVAMADLVVVNKIDLVPAKQVAKFQDRLKKLNAAARMVRTIKGQLDVAEIFGLSAMRTNVSPLEMDDWLGATAPTPDPLAGLSGFAPKPEASPTSFQSTLVPQSHHESRINSASLEIDEPIPAGLFDFWLEKLVAMNGQNILRIKGIVHVKGMEFPFVFHGVQHIFDAPVPLKSWSGGDTKSRVVIIARDMSEETLAASLKTLKLQPAGSQKSEDGMMVHTTEITI